MNSAEQGDGLFPLGRLCTTHSIYTDMCDNNTFAQEVEASLEKYVQGDWGETSDGDKLMNDVAVKEELSILASYMTSRGKIWINTEADRSVTTIMYPSE